MLQQSDLTIQGPANYCNPTSPTRANERINNGSADQHADRDEVRRRAAADFRRLFVDLGGKLRSNRLGRSGKLTQ